VNLTERAGKVSWTFGHRRALRMIAFVVSVNGKRVGTIGVGDSGLLGAHVSWSGDSGEPGNLNLDFGGLDSRTNEHVRWPDPPEIKIGDTITIQVIETDTVDTPTDRKPALRCALCGGSLGGFPPDHTCTGLQCMTCDLVEAVTTKPEPPGVRPDPVFGVG
jgi:hypothetical protein